MLRSLRLFKMLLFKGGVLIYAEHCVYIYIYIYICIYTRNLKKKHEGDINNFWTINLC